ncbi:EF-hand domain-containing protein [Amycolatopsis magusensis]|uniref:Ca2+-binding EF-hand superfamily protein n=1 Tax=Amycolatopsis magusensis TaxID=882444 RepID=A0ABS4PV22_9PSEU|nr:EF-hand domain-containing protein [Amycolatopsis magusensis]MBP2182693.1 Ca2+-binding EF-hand superfamily protein [Amycolatopsis magusensis]
MTRTLLPPDVDRSYGRCARRHNASTRGKGVSPMLTSTQIENIDRVFAMIDSSGDGRVTWDDFETLTRGIAEELGRDSKSTEIAELSAAYHGVWEYVSAAADLDQDGAVTRDEFRKAHSTQALSAGLLLDKWLVAADRCFDAADRDGHGYLTEDALAGVYRAGGITDRQVASAAFQAMDVNSNGRVDKAEFSANVRGLFEAVDKSMKGARMIG